MGKDKVLTHHLDVPFRGLPNLISIMAVVTLTMGGNVIRAVIAGIPIVAGFMLIATKMSPLFTELSKNTGMNFGPAGSAITAFTDGGNPIRFWLFHLLQGNLIAVALIAVVGAMLWFSWRNYRRMTNGQNSS
jgi:PTS system galactitol-specific IIC component